MDNILENLTSTEELALELFQQCVDNKQINIAECGDLEGLFSQFLDAALSIEKSLKANRKSKSKNTIYAIKKDA